MRLTTALCLSVLGFWAATAPANAQVVINELRSDQPGGDDDEFFELAGPPGLSLDDLTYIVLGDPGSGAVEFALPLAGNSIGASGYFVAAEMTFTLGVADLTTDLIFENSDNVTHMLVTNFTGAQGDDLDIDDDGVLDSTPWDAIVDLIAVIEEDNPPTDTEYHYGPPAVGPDTSTGGSFMPSHITRCPDITGTFFIQPFGIMGNETPGMPNFCPDCRPPLSVDCLSDCSADTVTLNWTNDDTYTDIEIVRDGVVIATIGGADSSYTDAAPPAGSRLYAVRGICTMSSDETECTVLHSPYGGESNIVVMAEEPDGSVDSAETIASILGPVLGLSVLLVDDLDCLSGVTLPADANIWVCAGSFPNATALTQDEGQLLLDYLSVGVNVYYEGADLFGFNDPTPFSDYDGVDNAIFTSGTSDDSLTALTGSDFAGLNLASFVDVEYLQDNLLGFDFNDQITPSGSDPMTQDMAGCESDVIWRNSPDMLPDPLVTETDYAVGVYYRTEAPFGNVISSSFEFGGFNGDQDELLELYLAALADTTAPAPCGMTGGGDEFIRGDANGDGGFDISDAVFTLAALFTPGAASPTCEDSADANDDGTTDISDAVFTLAALFTPGAASPSAPHPGCGEDPSMDTLDCGEYMPCP